MLVTSLGANPNSKFFYNRVKGELEQAMKDLPYQQISLFQPSLILGDRDESRPGEAFAVAASKFLPANWLGNYAPVQASAIADAMLQVASQRQDSGVHIYSSAYIRKTGRAD